MCVSARFWYCRQDSLRYAGGVTEDLGTENKLDETFDCESLRPVEYISERDPRTCHFGKTLADYHQDMSVLKLNDNVPGEIVVQFETTKNLYLYGWFVWRFFTVSELHAFTCLEFALRRRYGGIIPKKYYPKQKHPMLHALFRFAVDSKDVRNEDFETWRKITEEIELNYDEVEIEDVDGDWNYVEVLNEILPKWRNTHAHGSGHMDMFHGPRHTIQLVSEVINQIYSRKPLPA